VNRENVTWSVRTGDFFPYADCPHCYWYKGAPTYTCTSTQVLIILFFIVLRTGYFTSRPALKGYVRSRNNLLHAIDKLFVSVAPSLSDVNVKHGLHEIDVLAQVPAPFYPFHLLPLHSRYHYHDTHRTVL
jgi:hypothetical protein